jgi:hypothetical protein
MSHAAAASIQPTWEYVELSRKTETYLLNDLNDLGQAGWELVTILYHRDIKMGESWLWTAFLKRRKAGDAQVGSEAAKAAVRHSSPAAQTRHAPAQDGGASDVFDIKEE